MMKKWICLGVMLVCLLFTACGAQQKSGEPQTITVNGKTAIVELVPESASAGEIQSNGDIYSFSYELDGGLRMVYPDGSEFTYRDDVLLSGLDTPDPQAEGYFDPISLAWAIEDMVKGRPEKGGFLPRPAAIVILALGIWLIWKPKQFWFVSYGWQYKESEPSELAMGVYRASGILFVILGVFGLLTA